MTNREKQLLMLLIAVVIVIGGMMGVQWWQGAIASLESKSKELDRKLMVAQASERVQAEFLDQIDWLEVNRPEASNQQDVSSELQNIAAQSAAARALEIIDQDILALDPEDEGVYQSARIRFRVSGTEQSLFQWLDQMQQPTQFRAVKQFRLQPKKDDDTKVSALVRVEQWYIDEGE